MSIKMVGSYQPECRGLEAIIIRPDKSNTWARVEFTDQGLEIEWIRDEEEGETTETKALRDDGAG